MIVVAIFGLFLIWYFFYGSLQDPQLINISKKLLYDVSVLLENKNWDDLLHAVSLIECKFHNMGYDTVDWVHTDMPYFSFLARKKHTNEFSLDISGSANNTSKLYFGFSITIFEDRSSWLVSIETSMLGFKPTSEAKKLAILCTSLLKKSGERVIMNDNGKYIQVN